MKSTTFAAVNIGFSLVQCSLLGVTLLQQLLLLLLAVLPSASGSSVVLVGRQNGGSNSSALQQCESPCSPIMSYVGQGSQQCTVQACCTDAFEQSYVACFTCIGNAENKTDFSSVQKSLDALTASCLANGASVTKMTFPGQDPNRALPSGALNTTASTTGSSGGGSTTITTGSGGSGTRSVSQTAITTASAPSQSSTRSSSAAVKTVEGTFLLPLVLLALGGLFL